jgi:hypothetical protein
MAHPYSSIAHPELDFCVRREGNLFLLTALSDRALAWEEEHLPPDRMTFGRATVVDQHYMRAIACAIVTDGLLIQ